MIGAVLLAGLLCAVAIYAACRKLDPDRKAQWAIVAFLIAATFALLVLEYVGDSPVGPSESIKPSDVYPGK